MKAPSKPLQPRRQATTDNQATLDGVIPEGAAIDGVIPEGASPEDAGIDATDEEPETGPVRRCVVTRERLPKEQMFRFVVSPGGALVPDLAGKLPGRGIWLSASRDVIEGGERTRPNGKPSGTKGRELVRAVARAARGPVQVPSDLPLVLETALIRRIGDFLGLARRAGQAIAGFEKARDWMRTRPVGLVLQAADGSEAERARFRSAVPAGVPVLGPLTGAELGRVFGHDTVVHVALAPGRLASSIAMEAARLAGLRTSSLEAAEPRSSSPEAMGPRSSSPEAMGPRSSSPEAMGPRSSSPEAMEPRSSSPEAMEPRSSSPEAMEPRSTSHEATETGTASRGATGSGPASHGATGRETAGINDATGTNG